MSNTTPKKVNLPLAISKRSKFRLDGDTITTTDFNKVKSVFVREVVPGDKFTLKTESLIRTLSPLAVPTYGRYKVINRTFFVPMRTIMRNWDAFITETPTTLSDGSIPSEVPKISNADILGLLFNNGSNITWVEEYILQESFTSTLVNCVLKTTNRSAITGDFFFEKIVLGGDNEYYCYELTLAGRRFIDIWRQCGYNICFDHSVDTQFSLLPFLAYAKIYFDYYLNPQYSTTFVAKLFNVTSASTLANSGILSPLVYYGVSYNPDYFTSAWQNPNGPNGSSSVYVLPDGDTGSATNTSDGSCYSRTLPSVVDSHVDVKLSSVSLRTVLRLSNFLRRNQIAGYKAFDRHLARFDTKLSSQQTNRSLLLDSDEINMTVSEVTSMSDTIAGSNGAGLGQLAGKSLGYGKGKVKFKSDEFGYIFVMSSLIPQIGYYQGVPKTHRHIGRLDFFQPEFDNLGTQAIAKSELWFSHNNNHPVPTTQGRQVWDFNSTFGFAPRFAEYKVGSDCVHGDFRFPSRNLGLDSYHLFREVFSDGVQKSVNMDDVATYPSLGFGFVQGRPENDKQYMRIFNNQDLDYDHFVAIFHVECTAERNMVSLMDSLLPEDSEHDHRSVEVSNGGSFVN